MTVNEYMRMMMAMALAMTTTTMVVMMTMRIIMMTLMMIMKVMTMMTLCFLLLQGLPGEGSLKNEEGDAPAVCHPQIRMTSCAVIFSSKKASSFDADRHPTLRSNRTSSSNTSLLHHLQIVSF